MIKHEFENYGTIYNEDCIDVLDNYSQNSFDMILTSPPYDDLREYEKKIVWNFKIFKKIANLLYKVLKKDGVLVWVVNDMVKNKGESLSSFKQVLYFNEIGFKLHDTMIYMKDSSPFKEKLRYTQVFEYMFILKKGGIKTFNPIQVMVKFKGINKKQGIRKSDGTMEYYRCDYNEYQNLNNVWKINNGYMKTTKDIYCYEQPAMFPEELARRHILTWTNKNDLILDPFAGAGTTLKMALLNDRKFVGIEKVENYYIIIKKRIEEYIMKKENKYYIPEEENFLFRNIGD